MVATTGELAELLGGDVIVRAGFRVSCDRAEGAVPVLRRRLAALLLRLLLEDARRDGSLAPGVVVEDMAATVPRDHGRRADPVPPARRRPGGVPGAGALLVRHPAGAAPRAGPGDSARL
ncbi:hypothetical protein [Streptomyces cinereospinus]|uniref:Uncharacterized protein n=1 Tax=Streptomyces cinereospinus TaxID=285561 RepID=A0ABV5N552_9ACTN